MRKQKSWNKDTLARKLDVRERLEHCTLQEKASTQQRNSAETVPQGQKETLKWRNLS
ncbi:carbon-nitrogen hydrolase [Sesbania bispinosa]|nr:carbon-nitrogen hydrolase [Sesbania bispinosa]